jgi:hypothetical protein
MAVPDGFGHDPGQVSAVDVGRGKIGDNPMRLGYRQVLDYCPIFGVEASTTAMKPYIASRCLVALVDDELDFVVWELTEIPHGSGRCIRQPGMGVLVSIKDEPAGIQPEPCHPQSLMRMLRSARYPVHAVIDSDKHATSGKPTQLVVLHANGFGLRPGYIATLG